jgi:hypothetical protein
MKYQIVIIIGIALMAEGFMANIYSSSILFPPTEPPVMRPIEGMDYVLYVYKQAFLASAIVGVLVTFVGIFLWRKQK